MKLSDKMQKRYEQLCSEYGALTLRKKQVEEQLEALQQRIVDTLNIANEAQLCELMNNKEMDSQEAGS